MEATISTRLIKLWWEYLDLCLVSYRTHLVVYLGHYLLVVTETAGIKTTTAFRDSGVVVTIVTTRGIVAIKMVVVSSKEGNSPTKLLVLGSGTSLTNQV